jgi:hypothetical protein
MVILRIDFMLVWLCFKNTHLPTRTPHQTKQPMLKPNYHLLKCEQAIFGQRSNKLAQIGETAHKGG